MRDLAQRLEARFHPLLAASVLFYLFVEIAYVLRLPLVMDEFQGAATVMRLRSLVPYVDFVPYKTVLGYYLQLPFTMLTDDPWLRLIFVKLGMVFVTAAAIYASARLLARQFAPAAVLLATLLLVVMSTFLERSGDLRVDMLTGLAGLLGLVFLLERRLLLAGILTGASFLVSQKGIYFVAASGVALLTHWAWLARDRASFRDGILHGAGMAIPVALYFAVWTLVASYDAVFQQVVVKGQGVALNSFYEIRHFWFQTIQRNPYFWAIAVLALGQLYWLRDRGERERRDWLLLVYGATLFALCLWHKQPWPYFFVLLIPTAWVLAVSFYDAELRRGPGMSAVALGILVVLGVGLPASRIPGVLARDNSFQGFTVAMADKILEEGDTYLAGLEMIPSHRQASGKLSWLDERRIASLEGIDHAELFEELSEARLKLVIGNYRIPKLPQPIVAYLSENYYPLFGNFLIFAPTIRPGTNTVRLPFPGTYSPLGPPGAVLQIAGRPVAPGDSIRLDAGTYTILSQAEVRLRFIPSGFEDGIEQRFAENRALFDDAYTY